MTTAFILALIAAVGVSVVLFAAINHIRGLERDNAWLMRIIGEQNEEQAKLCKERDEAREDAEHYEGMSVYYKKCIASRDVLIDSYEELLGITEDDQ